MKRRVSFCVLLILAGCQGGAGRGPDAVPRRFDGEITSSGGEFVTVEKNPWYVGRGPVRYCIAQGSDFSLDPARARALVKEALAEWADTIRALKPRALPVALADGERGKTLTLAFDEVSCDAGHALTISLGAPGSRVRETLAHHAKHTVALALRTAPRKETGATEDGEIWLAPDTGADRYTGPAARPDFWRDEERFYSVFLHETGHLFGFTHEMGKGTVMAAEYPASVVAASRAERGRSRLFVARNWFELGGSVCGELKPVWNEWASVTGLPSDGGLGACLTDDRKSATGGDGVVTVEITSRATGRRLDGRIVYPMAYHVPAGQKIEVAFGVGGHYSVLSGGRFVDYEHTFLKLTDRLSVKGTWFVRDQRRAIVVEQAPDGKIGLLLYNADPQKPFGMIDLMPETDRN